MLAKYFLRRRSGAIEDVVGKISDVETPAQSEPSSEPACIDEAADGAEGNTKVVEGEAPFSTFLTSAFKVSVYDPDSDFDDNDDDESVLNTPTMDFDVELALEFNFVHAERSVNVCHVIGSMESCHALVEVPTPYGEPAFSEPLISAFKDAVYDDSVLDEDNDSDFSMDSQSLSETTVLDIEQVTSLDVEKSSPEVHVYELIQSCEAIIEEWTAPVDYAEPTQVEAPILATVDSFIVKQVRQAPLALLSMSRSSRTANTLGPSRQHGSLVNVVNAHRILNV